MILPIVWKGKNSGECLHSSQARKNNVVKVYRSKTIVKHGIKRTNSIIVSIAKVTRQIDNIGRIRFRNYCWGGNKTTERRRKLVVLLVPSARIISRFGWMIWAPIVKGFGLPCVSGEFEFFGEWMLEKKGIQRFLVPCYHLTKHYYVLDHCVNFKAWILMEIKNSSSNSSNNLVPFVPI